MVHKDKSFPCQKSDADGFLKHLQPYKNLKVLQKELQNK